MARRQPVNALGVAGWLFAELALVLMIVALGSDEHVPAAESSTPSASASLTPTTTSAAAAPEGLSLTTRSFIMSVDGSGTGVVDEFRRRLLDEVGPDGRVGLILVFGKSRDPSVPTQGTLVSQQLKDLVVAAGLPQLSTMNDMRAYLGSEGAPGDAKVELFLFNGGR
ncbi:hypothetical protein SAMN04488564_10868 [Lentzea waywayandensis]|uniref:Uncharacterized protein n=1 Tax=Lentzea waywayandensis TaxID=84724 RepID=A0A1I6F4G6_9PSEU|nr:hypothetical protein [Lentzea waywayandensis]SFR24784.1 hypothetical protein SAMN04488564_10868 [Lentzea waywayandensis]